MTHEDRKQAAADVTRRSFLGHAVTAAGVILTPVQAVEGQLSTPSQRGKTNERGPSPARNSSFLNLIRSPDTITACAGFNKTLPSGRELLQRSGELWTSGAVTVQSQVEQGALLLSLRSPARSIAAVHVRWNEKPGAEVQVLGDAWERSYGDLGWRPIVPERVMPWYFATHDGAACHGYGVRTHARALCFWQLDQQGVSLWLNVTNGGNGVELGARTLEMASVVDHRGDSGEPAMAGVTALCRAMCARKSRPTQPIYGTNDWCYSYGSSTAQTILRDTDFLAELSPAGSVRPFSVIDGGWIPDTHAWPDMGQLAQAIKRSNARPGIWVRPLEAPKDEQRSLLLPDARFGDDPERARQLAYDPTLPEAAEKVRAKLRQLAGWGYEMVKHDFSTFDLLGQWGFEMGPQPTRPGWSLYDRSMTNAEAVENLYALIRETLGDLVVVDGCNTIGHLGQGLFDLQRIGDDTSGRQWERTRRMGVNTLAFRIPQHETLFTVDADLVGITDAVPWEFNRQWLDLLARSGSTTMISPGPPARGREQRAAIREAFQIAAAGGLAARPMDWIETSAPERWSGAKSTQEQVYSWSGSAGASPFLAP